jgi:peptide/nickel transport system permease protein
MTKRLKVYFFLFLLLLLIFTVGVLTMEYELPSGEILEPPSMAHICGTDVLGVDIYGQVSKSFFSSMFTGLCAALFASVLGGILGVLAGYIGGKPDTLITFVINIFLSVPELPVMIMIGAFLGQSRANIIMIVAVFSWAPIAKIVRAKTIDIRNSGYLKMAECYGGKLSYLFCVHMYRDILPLVIVNGLFVVGKAIVQESSLAFLGLSDPTARSWGLMINKALSYTGIYFTDYWKWWLMIPLICLVCVTVLLRLFAKEFERIMLTN